MMKKSSYIRISLLSTLLLIAILGIAQTQSEKVIQIFRNGKVIKQYPADYIDYIEVNDVDNSEGNKPGGIVIPESPAEAMRDSVEQLYINLTTTSPYGGIKLPVDEQGYTSFQRALFNLEELPTDEAKWIWDSYQFGLLNYGIVKDSNMIVLAAYLRLISMVNLCNEFINRDFNLEYIDDKIKQCKAIIENDEYIRQAKILRSAMYFYLINEFGNVPYSDENSDPNEIAPQLSTDFATGRRLLTEKVVATLEDMVDWYEKNDPTNKPQYGQVGLDVAEALLVKFYLNYEVFTGEAAWERCLDHAKSIIARRGKGGFQNSGLSMNYFQNFSYNNRMAADNEIIWRIATLDSHGNTIPNYWNGAFMIAGFAAEDERYNFHLSDYNSQGGWRCMVTTRQLVEVFEWNDDFSESPDQRTRWWGTAKNGFSIDNKSFIGDDWGKNGFIPIKFTNWNINDDGSVDNSNIPHFSNMSIDYGMIRLAEIYLSAAEAILNGAGSTTEALQYTNYVRERAGMPPFSSLTMNDLRAERQRELYTECNRRTDLIRYGLWTSGYNWSWKGCVKEGTDYDPNFIVYPLPASIVAEYGYTQNPLPKETIYYTLNTSEVTDVMYGETNYMYIVGSPVGWADPELNNYSAYKNFRLKKLSDDSNIYIGFVELPANSEFYFTSSLMGNGIYLGSSVAETGVELKYTDGEISTSLSQGKGLIKLENFKGGKLKVTVDMTDENNILLSISDRDWIYIIGNVMNPETEEINNWLAPNEANKAVYDNHFRLFTPEGKLGEKLYVGHFYLSPKGGGSDVIDNYSQFRFYTQLKGWPKYGWGSDSHEFYVVQINEYLDNSGLDGWTLHEGNGSWGYYCEEKIPITIVVDLYNRRSEKLYVKKGFQEVTFEDRKPIFK